MIYIIGANIFDKRAGLFAAVFMFALPLIWFQSEVALSHIIELPFAIIATWLLYEIFFNKRYAVAAAIIIGIGAGFRQDVVIFYVNQMLILGWRGNISDGERMHDLSPGVSVWSVAMESDVQIPPYSFSQVE